jgi:hypothetical protein
MKQYLKIFQEKLGDDVPMEIEFWFKDIDLQFKPSFGPDVVADYTFCISFKDDVDGAK